MKAILIVCLLLTSTFFIPSSNAAREFPIGPIRKCGRGIPYGRCISSPPLPQFSPLKPPSPPLKPPTTPTPGPPYRKATPPSGCKCNPYVRDCPKDPPYRKPPAVPLNPPPPPLTKGLPFYI
ncbi:hypothetical protein CMV_021393 [Castanea mollissima]|uniref:Uncharacterized protein n=1 Tax=Castanea mollissima TaxID=60419 RepID=A0A8J4QUA2_9ROSI|nr:hypothetical protein CMV_021393 [Castanea mollissima]